MNRLLAVPLLAAFSAFFIAQPAMADQVRFLAHPQDSMTEFNRLVAGAQTSIDVATFIFDPCSLSTRVLMQGLKERAAHGVRVRLLLDSLQLDSSYRQNLIDEANASGIQLRLYADSLTQIDARMHIKFLTVDRRAVLTGGRNLADQYFSLSSRLNYVDRDISVEGAAGAQAAAYFEELWQSGNTSTPSPQSYGRTWASLCDGGSKLTQKVNELKMFITQDGKASLSQVPVRNCSQTMFRSDNPDFRSPAYGLDASDMNPVRLSHKRATNHMLQFMNGAHTDLKLENYAYMPLTQISDAFAALRARHLPVEVLSNADMEDGPDFFIQAEEVVINELTARDSVGSQSIKLISSHGGLRDAHRLTPAGAAFFLHGKTGVRDHRDVMVGSFNLDARSASINLESMVVVTNCPELAQDVEAVYDGIRAVGVADKASGKIPVKPEPSALAKVFAALNVGQF